MFKALKQIRKINSSRLSDDEWYDEDSNGRGIIDVGAENYDDIFSYYDLEGENVLDREFVEFIEAKADAIPLKKELALHFHVKGANEEKSEEIDRAIKGHYKKELRASIRQMGRTSKFALYMFLMGLVFTAIYIPLTIFDVYFVVPYIFDIAAWVFYWEAVDQWFIHRRGIKHDMLKKYRFIRASIDLYEYKTKKKQQKFGNNAKSLNKILKQVDKENKLVESKITKIKKITSGEENV